VFFEDVFPYKREEDKTSGKRTHETLFRDESLYEPTVNAEAEPRRNTRSRIFKSFNSDFIACTLKSKPQIYKKAIPKAKMWKEAIYNEIESILNKHTWEL